MGFFPRWQKGVDTYLTVTGSGSSVGLDADVYIEYIRLA